MKPQAQPQPTRVLLNKVTEANNLNQEWREPLLLGDEPGQNPPWCMEELLPLDRASMPKTSTNTPAPPARSTPKRLHTSMRDSHPVDTSCSRREETWTRPDDNSPRFTFNTPVLLMSIELCLGSGEYYTILYFNNDKQGVLKLCHIVYFKILTPRYKVLSSIFDKKFEIYYILLKYEILSL